MVRSELIFDLPSKVAVVEKYWLFSKNKRGSFSEHNFKITVCPRQA